MGLADLLYPELCIGCGKRARAGVCTPCLQGAARVETRCQKCGSPASSNAATCFECASKSFVFTRAIQVFRFEGIVRRLIHRLKYNGEWSLARSLSSPLAEAVSDEYSDYLLTWVPISHKRLQHRGFDQAEVLARQVSSISKIRCAGILERIGEPPTSVGLTLDERAAAQAQTMRARIPPGPRIVLLDDVFTTGATASEGARALMQAGALEVVSLCVARTMLLPA